ncbi:MAG TPA: hypothetical protein PK788_13290 [Gemmatimonadaceae bacterium]|nr:hypothetical protein [Gemmatimonadaceae bacterium]
MSYLIGRLAMASTLGAAGLLVSSASADAQSTVRAIRIGQPTADSIGASTPRISGRGGFRTATPIPAIRSPPPRR